MRNDHESRIYERLEEVFQSVFNDCLISLTSGTTAEDIPGWDSLAYINIITGVEQRFGVQFSSSELEMFRDIGALVDCLKMKGA